MKYLFARDWPLKIYCSLTVTGGVWVAIDNAQPSLGAFRDWQFDVLLLISILVGGALAFFVLLPFGALLLTPAYYVRARLNGAPYQIGDRVRILVGPYRHRVAAVYAVWKDRDQVRVDVGVEANESISDVFTLTQVCREKAT